MRITVLGANGFIGRQIIACLLQNGHSITAIVRNTAGLVEAFPEITVHRLDLATAAAPEAFMPLISGTDIIVNAAGVLRGPTMPTIHVTMPEALYAAALRTGVKKCILISAISARPDVQTDYSQSKLRGEENLRNSGLHFTILRPSLVYGSGSYGGTSLLRALAAFPFFIPVPGDGKFLFTPINVKDLAHSIAKLCVTDATGQTLEPVGPDTLTLNELLGAYRAWLGFGKPRFLSIPMSLMTALGRIGDAFGSGPVSTNSLAQMMAGNAGASAAFAKAIGFQPASLHQSLRDHPAEVQDRWHARLYFLVPALKASLILMWVASGVFGILNGQDKTLQVVDALHLGRSISLPLLYGSCGLDVVIAGMLLFAKSVRWVTLLQLFTVMSYTMVLSFALPSLWTDPLGPLLKNLPILCAILAYGATGNRR